ncbi:hypothetical protein KL933_001285 [Ogataea haglerorum]|uniref:Inosine/uridine-preferring nucleoside hydrolase domain-containing protein n=1 Tax=Ogataea haglerorum TaxID=1937702 RepID=A0AAN6I247_9ASCO|nr:hypothetical protein KL915_002056 [Ogataea haglerorum]KAG7730205.1 hypothetical protein KL933_001285 [Ogataea haglerorum]KAG7792500.1 hypothetical protein KL910_000740 [Ogataea haglerorum]KAG7792896.1 hypothetical protein KL945_000001 [Ogataea haglerorum]
MKIKYLLLSLAPRFIASAKKVFIDNDGLDALQLLYPLYGGYEIVGISMSFGSVSAVDGLGQAYDLLVNYNLSSCIPLYLGAEQPLMQTNETFHIHNQLFGAPVWEGAFASSYRNSYNWSDFTYKNETPGAVALIEAVRKYKDTDPVAIFAAGMMTTVAQALSIYPRLAEEAAGLYIMGGYIDTQYAQATGNSLEVDINTDINLIQDPEGAQITLTAPWKKIVIGGNFTNYITPSQEIFDRIIDRAGGMSVIENTPYLGPVQTFIYDGNYTDIQSEALPYWDDAVAAIIGFPNLILDSLDVKCAVDTAFYSPFYGNLRVWGEQFAPTSGIKTGNGTFINAIQKDVFYDLMVEALFTDWRQYCHTGKIFPYEE